MSFPNITPTSRTIDYGDWPIKTYRAQSGREYRILYGDQRHSMTLDLEWSNITTAQLDQFFNHYRSNLGTFRQFSLGTGGVAIRAGWDAGTSRPDLDALLWRYAAPPSVDSTARGRHNLKIKLISIV